MRSLSFTCPNLSSIFRPPVVTSADLGQQTEASPLDPIMSDVTCAIYNGGRIDGVRGMEVVAHVIQNRANHPAFPSDPQSVVLAGKEQFVHKQLRSPLLQSVLEKQLFDQARRLAGQLIYPPQRLLTPDPTGGALYYDKRGPVWLHSINRPTGFSGGDDFAGGGTGASAQPRQPVDSIRSQSSTAAASRSPPAIRRQPSSDSYGGDSSPPSLSPRPERPNRSRRPFSFLRDRSVAGLCLFCRRSDGRCSEGTAAAAAADVVVAGNTVEQSRSSASGSGTAQSRRESRRRQPTDSFVGREPGSYPPAVTLHGGPTALQRRRDGDMILPCGLFQEEVIDLMYRDLSPEDFEMLCKLDERLPNRNTAQRNLIDVLPRVLAKDCGATECRVCLSDVEPNTPLAKLPCQHYFHPQCISKWLTQCKNTCPLCSAPIAHPATEGSKDHVPCRRSDAATSSHAAVLHREGHPSQRHDEPRPRPITIQAVRSLHL